MITIETIVASVISFISGILLGLFNNWLYDKLKSVIKGKKQYVNTTSTKEYIMLEARIYNSSDGSKIITKLTNAINADTPVTSAQRTNY